MNIFRKIRRLLCVHRYKYEVHHLIGTHLKCTKCGHIISLKEYIDNNIKR